MPNPSEMLRYENAEHHFEEEEREMLPKADQLGLDRLEAPWAEMEELARRLMTNPHGRTNGTRSGSTSGGSRSAWRTRTRALARSHSR